jgi:hypothetical protein
MNLTYNAYTSHQLQINGTEAMRIDSNGNLGVGSTVPTQKLDVNGSVNVSGTVAMGSQYTFRNKLINGGFDIWQRGTSFTDWSGDFAYAHADRFKIGYDTGSTPSATGRTVSRQTFTLGQTDVPGDPTYYFSYTFPNLGTPSNYLRSDIVEGVRMFAGKTCTFSFWAKVPSGTMAIGASIAQEFGSGTGGSAGIYPATTNFTATTTWQRFSITRTLSSITGKTLGSNLYTDRIWPYITFPTGAAGTIYLAQWQLEEGAVATPFERRPLQVELALCQRFYEKSYNFDTIPGTSTFIGSPGTIGRQTRPTVSFRVEKAFIPTVTIYNPSTGASGAVYNSASSTSATVAEIGTTGYCLNGPIATGTDNDIRWQWVASAEN